MFFSFKFPLNFWKGGQEYLLGCSFLLPFLFGKSLVMPLEKTSCIQAFTGEFSIGSIDYKALLGLSRRALFAGEVMS